MHYFTYGPHIAAVEDDDQAAKYEAAGWCAVSRATFMGAWEQRDAQDFSRMRAETAPMVMETAPIKDWMPAGYQLFQA